jgi:hypothetical protein
MPSIETVRASARAGGEAFPAEVVILESALLPIWRCSTRVWLRRRWEWGGLLWGRTELLAGGGSRVTVVAATTGPCGATAVSCEILPACRALGRRQLARRGLAELQTVGDWHSHPGYGVFLSRHADQPAFWAKGHIPSWLSCVIDPCRLAIGFFGKDTARSFRAIPAYRLADEHHGLLFV